MKLKNFWFFVLVYKVHPDTFCTNEKDREVLLVAICYGFGGKNMETIKEMTVFFMNTALHTARCNWLILDLLCYSLCSLGYIIIHWEPLFFITMYCSLSHCHTPTSIVVI